MPSLLHSIKPRIAITVLLLFLASIWSLTYYATHQLQQSMTEVLKHQQFSHVSQAAAEIEGKINLRLQSLQRIASEITPAMLASPDKLHELLAHRPLLTNLFGGGVIVIDKSGLGRMDHPPIPGRTGSSFAGLPSFEQVLATRKPALGKAQLGKFSGTIGVPMNVPVFDPRGEIIGVLGGFATVSDSSLFGNILDARVGQSGWLSVNDSRNRIIVAISDRQQLLRPFPAADAAPLLERFANGHAGSDIGVDTQGREVLASASNIGDTGWFVMAALPTAEAFAPIRGIAQQLYAAASLLSLLVLVVVWWIV